ncbi:hypothetical protein F4809DRAFT_595936 [Biscogniauxia mediterranea]|nr:hypothetical protein F4809DRAFT_595936 [Biscogniauxia mediterranea]
MPPKETAPLLSKGKKGKGSPPPSDESAESTPLLSGATQTPQYDGRRDNAGQDRVESIRSRLSEALSGSSSKPSRRWPSFIAMGVLGLFITAIIILAFVLPQAVQEYTQQAAVLEPTSLSLDSITTNGIRARVQANFRLDGSRVTNQHVRRMGRAATFVARQIESEQTRIDVSLPDYKNIVLGSAAVPPLLVNLRDGDVTHFDFVADIKPGSLDGIRMIANEWLEGRLEWLRLKGVADVSLKTGILPLGMHSISESLVFEANKIPAIPQYNMSRFNIKDGPINGSMLVDASLSAFNKYPVELDIPELSFEILVSGCADSDPLILVAEAATGKIHVEPHSDVTADVNAVIRGLPEPLTRACPHSNASPLDVLLRQYMHGEPATVFVRGSSNPDGNAPKWVTDILSSITLSVPFPGRTLDGLIRSFSLTDVHFTLPNPLADPEGPDANPKVSGNVLVIAGLPSEMNFGLNVTNIRASADVFYKSKKMGELDLRDWQRANSTKVECRGNEGPSLEIESRVIDAPLNITDTDVFSSVLQALLFGTQTIQLSVDALVDVKVETSVGGIILKEIPAEGKIPVKPLPKGTLSTIDPQVGSLKVLDTSADSVTIQAVVNITNPTPYTAHIPFINVHVLKNGSIVGDATVENVDITKGLNTDVVVTAKWNPSMGGTEARRIGRDLISQYISGWNTSITVKAHSDSIPGQREISEALSQFNVSFAAPRLDLPGDTPEEKSHFVRDATFHFFSSTASFTLISPLEHNTLYLDYINATAFYNHTEPVGYILYDLPFAVPPGESHTPRLPVDWSFGSIGYDALVEAIGGELKLDAYADVDIRLGNWKESLWYQSKGIGASVKL